MKDVHYSEQFNTLACSHRDCRELIRGFKSHFASDHHQPDFPDRTRKDTVEKALEFLAQHKIPTKPDYAAILKRIHDAIANGIFTEPIPGLPIVS